jgi:single-strand DNA-binding protein
MPNLNHVYLMGHLTRDVEMRHMPSGDAVASFGLAVNHRWRSKDGEDKTDTCFIDVSMFGKRAEIINQYFSKGKPIFIEGRLKYEKWETKDGQKRSTIKVIADNFQFIGDNAPKAEKVDAQKHFGSQDINDEEIPF